MKQTRKQENKQEYGKVLGKEDSKRANKLNNSEREQTNCKNAFNIERQKACKQFAAINASKQGRTL